MTDSTILRIGEAAGVVYNELLQGECNMTHLKKHLLSAAMITTHI